MSVELGKLTGYQNFSQREFDEGYSELLDERKLGKLQRLQDQSQMKGINL
jgi:hypothetical protein